MREAERLLTAVFAEEEWGEDGWGPAGPRSGWERPLPVFWRIAAVIRPLGLIAGPGRGWPWTCWKGCWTACSEPTRR
ncbi:hypothetical protein [Streptomyces barringtoniae]|uniref:hypothetical protein n=1 Tax=Streptomyces barringtoniae TaxID=2892029 RepID=UPI001E37C8EE|nr:hypothetical protein [Streptomyces barringtoniae]MCC5474654.1 hypothetical protein [Streptomyces barringtoniae]